MFVRNAFLVWQVHHAVCKMGAKSLGLHCDYLQTVHELLPWLSIPTAQLWASIQVLCSTVAQWKRKSDCMDWLDGWMLCRKKMSQLQDFNVLKYMVYMNIITFKGLKFYKVDSHYWPAKQHELKCWSCREIVFSSLWF